MTAIAGIRNFMEEFKIRQKTEDMIRYGYIALRQFPKTERYTLAANIRNCMHDLLRLIITANKRYFKKTTIQDLDIELEILRSYIRLSYTAGFLPFKKYEVWAKLINEIGCMVGGWIKSVNNKQ